MQVAAFVIPVKIIFCFSRPSFLPPRKGVQRLPSSQSHGPACSHVSLCPVPTPGCGLSPQWTSEHQAQETGPGWPRPVCAHPPRVGLKTFWVSWTEPSRCPAPCGQGGGGVVGFSGLAAVPGLSGPACPVGQASGGPRSGLAAPPVGLGAPL